MMHLAFEAKDFDGKFTKMSSCENFSNYLEFSSTKSFTKIDLFLVKNENSKKQLCKNIVYLHLIREKVFPEKFFHLCSNFIILDISTLV